MDRVTTNEMDHLDLEALRGMNMAIQCPCPCLRRPVSTGLDRRNQPTHLLPTPEKDLANEGRQEPP
jgi:hypothetical protein